MPSTLKQPGVYIEELASGVRTITGVGTSIAAFVGRALRGPVNEPVTVNSLADYERQFGGLWNGSAMSFAVQDFFQNGGGHAVIVRVHKTGVKATVTVEAGTNDLLLEAVDPGAWGNKLSVTVVPASDSGLFSLSITDGSTIEVIRDIAPDLTSARRVDKVLAAESQLLRYQTGATAPSARPADAATATGTSGSDGVDITQTEVKGVLADKTGMYALEKADLFNLLCIPPYAFDPSASEVANAMWGFAADYAAKRRAMLLVDPVGTWTKSDAITGVADIVTALGANKKNAALFFPRLRMADLNNNLQSFAPCGAVAGIIARTDAERGVWKAPAGMDAGISGATLSVPLTGDENGELNPLAINCLRTMPGAGNVIWGTRTLAGNDRTPDDWKYIPVRRTALFIEESLYRGTQWAVFEPNDEPLWSQIRLNIGAFMNNLFRQGAFQGKSPKEAYFVKCDKDTTTQNDINLGVVNILVGFAPLKPAEFVVIKLQQTAGQIAA